MPRLRSLWLLLASVFLAPFLAAQEPPAPELKTVAKSTLRYFVRVPAGYTAEKWVPMLVVFTRVDGEDVARRAIEEVADVVRAGFVAVVPVRGDHGQAGVLGNAMVDYGEKVDWRPLFVELRRTFRIEQGGMHGFVPAAITDTSALLASREQFQTVTFAAGVGDAMTLPFRRLPLRRLAVLRADTSPATHFTKLHAERTLPGVAGEVARVLDDFHDAAANADEGRYFAILPDDGVFLGTDGTERWTGAQFKKEYMRYFERDSAWTYVTLRRVVNVEPGDTIAWFDESFDNEAYGECRGSGVLCKRDGKWVLRQYHLTIPVPNDVARDVAARIRSFQAGVASKVPTIVLVRHAEKADESDDPQLSAAGEQRAAALAHTLRDVPIDGIYTSQFRRTVATVTPIAAPRKIVSVPVPATDVAALVKRLRDVAEGQTVLVCGHSNTVPKILKELGVPGSVTIADDEFDRMFVVTLEPGGPRMLSLRYGP